MPMLPPESESGTPRLQPPYRPDSGQPTPSPSGGEPARGGAVPPAAGSPATPQETRTASIPPPSHRPPSRSEPPREKPARRTVELSIPPREKPAVPSNGKPRSPHPNGKPSSPQPGGKPPAARPAEKTAEGDEDRGRMRRRKRANVGCLSGMLFFIAVVGLSFFLALFGWACVNDVLALMKTERYVTIRVPEGYTIPELSRQLKEAGVVEQGWLFSLYCNFTDASDIIDPGEYDMRTNMDYRAIVHEMVQKPPERTSVRIKVVEGRTLAQTLGLMAEEGVAPLEELLRAAEEGKFNYSFLEDLPEGPNRLEGFLYPDTYEFYQGSNPEAALRKFLSNFDIKYTASMRKRVSEMNYSLLEVLTVASLVQMEAAGVSDMKDIASVIYNRLANPATYPRLEIDATVQYLLPEHKEVLTAEDLAIDSPYNTRLYPGLPPGPICSPSIEAIRAALYPSKSNYFFYCMTDAGVHAFCKTNAELEQIKRNNPKTYPR